MGGQVDMGAYEYGNDKGDTTQHVLCEGSYIDINGQQVDTVGIFTKFLASTPTGDSLEYLVIRYDSINTGVDPGLFAAQFRSLEDSASYQWINCSSSALLVADTFQTYVPSNNGDYAVIITSKNGCVDTSECISINNVDLGELGKAELISLYPNPAQDVLHVQSSALKKGSTIEVYNSSGKLVQSVLVNSEDHLEIDIAKLKSGLYFLKADRAGIEVCERVVNVQISF